MKETLIITERPSYLGAIMAFKAYCPRFIDIPMDDDGMDMEVLEETLKPEDRVKFIYVIPDFQNPTGKTWSVDRRKKLIELANRILTWSLWRITPTASCVLKENGRRR
jgi:2-aminoadipate transaminase